MHRSRTPNRTLNHDGSGLAFLLMLIGILSALATGLAVMVRLDTTQQAAEETARQNFYAAEAGVNVGVARLHNVFLGFNVPQSQDFAPQSFTLRGQTINYQLAELPGNPATVTLPPGDAFAGLNSVRYRYTVASDSVGRSGNREARVSAEFNVDNIPLFQFAAFYAGDLEISPGPDMFLHGRVHTNSDLYLSAGNTLRIEDSPPRINTVQVSASKRVLRGRKDENTCGGAVIIDMLEDGPDPGTDLDRLELRCNGSGTREVTLSEASAWKGSLLVGLDSINPPPPDSIAKGSGIFWQRADLRLVLNLTASPEKLQGSGPLLYPIEVQNADGSRNDSATNKLRNFMLARPGKLFYNDVPNCASADFSCAGAITSYNPPFALPALVYRRADDSNLDSNWTVFPLDARRGGFFNNREKSASNPAGRWIHMLNLDLQAFLDYNRTAPPGQRLIDTNDTSDGGLVIFLTVQGPASGGINPYGVRVLDSSSLGFPSGVPDPTGVTVVSDQAIYLEGDYNTMNKAPAAIIGDSLNLLSSAWENNGNDRKTTLSLSDSARDATDTTMNTAFLAGVDVTTPGKYNGGFENYPRFHEDWGSRRLTYRGSFVSLGTPTHVDGPWCGTGGTKTSGCNIYNPPIRDWDYDPDLDNGANLPPLSPRVVYVQQTLFSQEFR